jgi:SEC-C motif-containing protein
METCPCGSGLNYEGCCGPLIKGELAAETAEQLMRARYTAYTKVEMDYLLTTLHPHHRGDYDPKTTQAWAEKSQWHGLEILKTEKGGTDDTDGQVEFIAHFTQDEVRREHHEMADFRKDKGQWYFVNGKVMGPKQIIRQEPKVGRNDPCICGSGKKYKKCCGV